MTLLFRILVTGVLILSRKSHIVQSGSIGLYTVIYLHNDRQEIEEKFWKKDVRLNKDEGRCKWKRRSNT